MENLRADITEFLKGLIITILGFFSEEEVVLSEEQVASIAKFVDTIFML